MSLLVHSRKYASRIATDVYLDHWVPILSSTSHPGVPGALTVLRRTPGVEAADHSVLIRTPHRLLEDRFHRQTIGLLMGQEAGDQADANTAAKERRDLDTLSRYIRSYRHCLTAALTAAGLRLSWRGELPDVILTRLLLDMWVVLNQEDAGRPRLLTGLNVALHFGPIRPEGLPGAIAGLDRWFGGAKLASEPIWGIWHRFEATPVIRLEDMVRKLPGVEAVTDTRYAIRIGRMAEAQRSPIFQWMTEPVAAGGQARVTGDLFSDLRLLMARDIRTFTSADGTLHLPDWSTEWKARLGHWLQESLRKPGLGYQYQLTARALILADLYMALRGPDDPEVWIQASDTAIRGIIVGYRVRQLVRKMGIEAATAFCLAARPADEYRAIAVR